MEKGAAAATRENKSAGRRSICSNYERSASAAAHDPATTQPRAGVADRLLLLGTSFSRAYLATKGASPLLLLFLAVGY
jgi:hypothetical protein